MADTVRLTAIENLPDEQREFVEEMLRHRPRPPLRVISQAYEKEFGDHLAVSTLHSHLKRRMQAELDRTRELLAEKRAIAAVIGEGGMDAAASAECFAVMQQMTPAQLILLRSVETKRKELELRQADQQRQIRELELKEKQWKVQRKQVVDAIGGVESNERVDAKEIQRRIADIFGVSLDAAQPDSAGAAVSSAVDQG